jgi:NADPH-dependent 2,4-dienoyl-CoA reductase/sulfur reductase-like enzyme/peroxiredoxin family protein/rhodanese-related sulfurtransferase/TusA-related sulfurtransferase
VGGVAGGATAAARARRLREDAEIVVLERGPYVSFANCGLPYHIGGDIANRESLLLQTPEALRARYEMDVRVRHEVVEIDRERREVVVRDLAQDREYRERYDRLILSPGAAPLRPPLPGIDHERIFTLRTVPDTDRIKAAVDAGAKSAIVVGGGFIGLEMVENLIRRGLSVYLVELLDQVMPPLDREMAEPIHQQLHARGVDLRLGDAVEAFADLGGRVIARLKSGAELTADLVILAIGVRAESKLAKDAGVELTERGAIRVDDRMRTSDAAIYAVGDVVAVADCVTGAETVVPLAGPANRQGRIAADNACGRDSRFRGAQGTSVLGLFDLTVAMTGASEKTLKRESIAYEKVYLHPAQHVGYYPGSAQMTIKLLFSPDDGRVLGGQIVGTDGVDKRIDVLATAIQARMTVYDLEELELAYAPQYGAAKDPLNMAGFIAANVLRGDVALAHADALDGALLLDVRNPEEFAAGAVSGAILIPLPELRSRHVELPKDRPIVAYCQVGMRGYVAARLLASLGYDVRNLAGGYRTWCQYHPEDRSPGCALPTGEGYSASPNATNGTDVRTLPSRDRKGACQAVVARGPDGLPHATNPNADPRHADQTLDVRGQCCPGPIVAVADALKTLEGGRVLEVLSSDSGFLSDIPAWCRSTGNELLHADRQNGHYVATIRKGMELSAGAMVAPAAAQQAANAKHGKTVVVFSGELDRVMAALIIANGAAAMGQRVTLFFTFWGLSALRRPDAPPMNKPFMARMFGWMLPKGAARLPLSRMHMGGMGKAMMNRVMRSHNVAPLATLLAQAQAQGVKIVACSMSLDVLGLKPEELIDGVEIAGVAAYLAEADAATANLFV